MNAVAYRSAALSASVHRMAKELVSARVHRTWLLDEIVPQVRRGERYVIAHRHGLWRLAGIPAADGIRICSGSEPRGKHPYPATLDAAEAWLATRTP